MPRQNETTSVEAFEAQFLSLRASLKSYLFRLTTNRQDAEDLVQDTYLKALKNLAGYAGKSSLKTWIFSIATNLARDHHRIKKRWFEDTQDRCREETQAAHEKVGEMRYRIDHSPVDQYEFREHINYCFTCLAKTLQLEHQLALILKEIYQFKVSEIMDILNLSEGRVKHALAQARRLMNDIFDRRCVLINKQGVCHQCSEMSGFVNPKQDAQQRALELKLVQEANLGTSREHLFDLRAELIRNLDPLQAPATSVHEYLLELMDQTVGSGF